MSNTPDPTQTQRQYKTFSLSSPRDLLRKLKWDISQLSTILSHTVEHHYQAINCAITAWQMCDWVFEELSEEEKKLYPNEYKFREHIKEQSRWLRICRELADSSKHRQLKHESAPDIGTPVVDVFTTRSGETLTQIFIYDGEAIHSPELVMLHAYDFWDEYLSSRGM